MQKVTTQAEFDSVVSDTPTDEMILIEAKKEPYTLSESWVLDSNVYIQGKGYPKIEFTGNFADGEEGGVIQVEGEEDSELTDIVIKGLHIIGNKDVDGDLHGIYGNYLGYFPAPDYPDKGYDHNVIGDEHQNYMGITIKDCIVEGNKQKGIHIDNSSNCKVINSRVKGNGDEAAIYKAVIKFDGGYCNSIISCISEYNGIQGINVTGDNSIVTGNTVQNNGNHGINNEGKNNTIIRNTCQNNGSRGINNIGNNCTITGNTSQNNHGHGIYNEEKNNTIIGNTCQNNGGGVAPGGEPISNGIRNNESNIAIIGNICQNNRTNGIRSNGENIAIVSNVLKYNEYYGIKLESDNSTVYANVTKGNDNGDYEDTGSDNTIDHDHNQFLGD